MGAVERYRPPVTEQLAVGVVKAIAHTELIPRNLRGNIPAIMATIIKGRALGLDDMHALTAVHFIEGKPTLSAEVMVMLARRAGHSITGDYGDGTVTAKGRRCDNGDEMSATWTLAMAQRAGLTGKDNWKRYPEAMLWARAVSQLCRMLFADVLAGAGYTPDEVELTAEERIAADIGDVGPPDDTGAPDDEIPGGEESPSEVIEGEVVPSAESEGEPQAAPTVSPADPPMPEPGSPSEVPPEGEQASIFEQKAAAAQATRKRRGVAD